MNRVPDRRSLALIGYRACGKSTLGRAVAGRFGWPFIDLDREIEWAHGRSIADLFREEGEAWFRDVEAGVLAATLSGPRHVLAPGGGVIVRPENRRLLREHAWVVHLVVSVDELVRRLRASPGRPALTDRTLEDEVSSMVASRSAAYEEARHLALDVPDGEAESETLRRLLSALDGLGAEKPTT